jgi:two-component system response regulator DegU
MTKINLFVFEDEWMCREAIQSVIDRTVDIELVGTAEKAEGLIKTIVTLKPDVVLMDIRLKGKISGIEATKIITKRCPNTRVIIFTNFPDSETLNAAILAGAAGYLLKEETSNPDILIQAIREVAQGNSYMTPRISAEILKVIRNRNHLKQMGLTQRELELVKLMAEGLNNREIARQLKIKERTVANHIGNILFKLNAKNRTEAVCIARNNGLLQ